MKEHDLFSEAHISSLRSQLETDLTNLAQVKARIRQKQAELEKLRSDIHDLALASNVLQSRIEVSRELLAQITEKPFPDDQLLSVVPRPVEAHEQIRRNPMDMLKPEFKGMQLGNIVEHVLERHRGPLTTTDIGRIIYDARDKDEFSRARNSLSAELRLGASKNPPRWVKKGRSAYVAQFSADAAKSLPSRKLQGGKVHAT